MLKWLIILFFWLLITPRISVFATIERTLLARHSEKSWWLIKEDSAGSALWGRESMDVYDLYGLDGNYRSSFKSISCGSALAYFRVFEAVDVTHNSHRYNILCSWKGDEDMKSSWLIWLVAKMPSLFNAVMTWFDRYYKDNPLDQDR